MSSPGLRAFLEQHSDGRRGWLARLTVLDSKNDPFRCDNATGHLCGAWLAEQIESFGLGDSTIHLRGIHYPLIGRPKPNGKPYANDDPNWEWLHRTVARAARWLGYVGWDQIHDERNAPPLVRLCGEPDPFRFLTSGWDVEFPDVRQIIPTANIAGFVGRQPYRLVLIGEKASLQPVLGPIADNYQADLYLGTGEISSTLIHGMAKTAAEDGRKMHCFYFSDCDPAGWQMSVSVGRKLQAFKATLFPEIEYVLHRVALNPDQVRKYELPDAPLKDTERRAGNWKAAMGVEQTEIDALATLQPDLLRELAEDAVDPFFDRTLERRVLDARADWLKLAQARLDEQIDAGLRDEAERKLRELRQQIEQLNSTLRTGVSGIEWPPVEIPEPVLPNMGSKLPPLIDSDWPWIEQTERLIAEKAYAD